MMSCFELVNVLRSCGALIIIIVEVTFCVALTRYDTIQGKHRLFTSRLANPKKAPLSCAQVMIFLMTNSINSTKGNEINNLNNVAKK